MENAEKILCLLDIAERCVKWPQMAAVGQAALAAIPAIALEPFFEGEEVDESGPVEPYHPDESGPRAVPSSQIPDVPDDTYIPGARNEAEVRRDEMNSSLVTPEIKRI